MKKHILLASILSLLAVPAAYAGGTATTYEINNEAELTNVIDTTTADTAILNFYSDIDFSANKTLTPGTNFKFYGNGHTVSTNGHNMSFTDSPSIYNLIINGNSIQHSGSGGAINTTAASARIHDSVFTKNISSGYGGAIFSSSTLRIYDSKFIENKSMNYGGAIYSTGENYISNSIFTENEAVNSFAGAVFTTDTSNINIYNSLFKENIAKWVGAIYITGTANIYDTQFIGNKASINAGAIHNQGTLNLIAQNSNTEFTDNTANNLDSAIYMNAGKTMNLNAGPAQIIFNDGIDVKTNSAIININASSADVASVPASVPTSGRIVLNAAMQGSSLDLNLYNSGSLYLGANGSININDLTMNDTSILNLANGQADIVNIDTLTANDTPSVWADVGSSAMDRFIINNSASGTINLKTFNILEDFSTAKQYLFLSNNFPTLSYADTYTNTKKYAVSDGTMSGWVKFTPTTTNGIIDAISSTGERSLSLTDDYTATENFTTSIFTKTSGARNSIEGLLTVFGNGHTVSGADSRLLFHVANSAAINLLNTTLTNGKGSGSALNLYGPNSLANVYSSHFNNNTGDSGCAIYNAGTVNLYDSSFSNNHADAAGGALYNNYTANIYNTTFSNNKAAIGGGAIANNRTLLINGSTFKENESDAGGAIYESNVANIYDTKFLDNKATTKGGAIYVQGATLNLIANRDDVEFTGNTAGGSDNAIFIAGTSKLNLNASQDQKIIFNDGISTDIASNTININGTNDIDTSILKNLPTAGEIVLNADMSGFKNIDGSPSVHDNRVNLYNGTLSLGSDGVFFDNINFYTTENATLNLVNNKIDNISFNNAYFDNSNIKIDVDYDNEKADNINAANVAGDGKVTIRDINIFNENSKKGSAVVTVDPDNEFNISLDSSAKTITGQIYDYTVTNGNDGTLTLDAVGYSAPVAMSTNVQQATVLNFQQAGNITMERADHVMDFMDAVKAETGMDFDLENKVAAVEGHAEYSTLYGFLREGNAWFRPFSNIEKISVDNVNGRVSSQSYGMVIGYDTDLKTLRRGYKGLMTVYGGYNGASQGYETVDLYQNGGFFGASGSLYKGNFYTTLNTTIGGTSVIEKIENAGSGNYGMLATSIAAKSGYNFHLPHQTTLQLNGKIGYSFIASSDYTNGQGTRIDFDGFHNLQLAPGFRLTKNINGWLPYFSSSVMFNALNDSNVRANEVALANSGLGTYVEYGAGIQKSHGEKETFVQAMVRNGSRKGVSLQFGIKIPTGKKPVEEI